MDSNKTQRVYKVIMLVIIVAMITFIITTIAMSKILGDGKQIVVVSGNDSSGLVSKITTLKNIIKDDFLGTVDEEKLVQGAIKGYVESLEDPYTQYFTKEEMEEFSVSTMGNFVGIGVYMTKNIETNQITIIAPIEGSPAEEAGIKTGDIITKVNGENCTGEDLDLVTSKIKGEEGTKVTLEIQRGEETFEKEITRRTVKITHVEAKELENNIGYLKLQTFDEGCFEEFKNKYMELKEKKITSLIIDLRNNGGGILDEALNIADLFVEKDKTLLITTDKRGKEEITKAKKDITIDMPVVILTNDGTASASEVLAGALKDNIKEIKIVGTKTYGKGVIQNLIPFTDGSGLKITVNEYYTPNKTKINGLGITPDEVIKLENGNDNQLQKAIEILKKC